MDQKQKILEQARILFFRIGLKSVTMDDIAADMGISKKTLYEYFSTKKEIVNQVTENFLCSQNDEHALIISESKNAVEELIRLMDILNNVFEHLDVRVIYDMKRYYPEAWEIFLKHKEESILKDVTANLQKGIEEGLFRSNINVEIIARMRLEQVQMAMDDKIFPADKYEIKEVHKQLLLQYINGLCTEKGHTLFEQYSGKEIFNS